MKTIGIISEYNPFHNGHKYHIAAARQEFGAENILCIMSGSFVQRGEPAIVDKWSRAKMALLNGADLVIELPFVYACQPAELFAFGAVNILNNLGIVDSICFGSELGDTAPLIEVASLLKDEPKNFSQLIRKNLDSGNTYPRSVSLALEEYYQGNETIKPDIWENPNNILGIEYIKSLMLLDSPIKPCTIKRIANDYNDMEITQPIASATAVRHELKGAGMSDKLKMSMPETACSILQSSLESSKGPVLLEAYSDILLYKLRTMETEEISKYMSIEEGLEYRIKKAAYTAGSLEELIEAIKTKRYTRAFIQRILCHILLDLKWSDSKAFKQFDTPTYCRVLGFNDRGKQLLRAISDSSPYPMINKVASFKTDNELLSKMFECDIRATDIYSLGSQNLNNKRARKDFMTSPVFV